MNFRRRRLASVLGLEVCDSLFDLTAPLRIFFAQLVRDPVDLKTFELAPLIEFIARAIAEFFHVAPQRRLIDFPYNSCPDSLAVLAGVQRHPRQRALGEALGHQTSRLDQPRGSLRRGMEERFKDLHASPQW